MAISFDDDAIVQTAIGIGPEGEVFGIFAGDSNPWDVITDAPQHSIYFQTDGTSWRKSGAGFTMSDWEAGLSESVQPSIEVQDDGVQVEMGPIILNYQYSLVPTNPAANEVDIALSGDVASPGNDKLYGTNGSGTRGWYDIPAAGISGITLEEDGTPVTATPHTTLNFLNDFTVTNVDGTEATIALDIGTGAATARLNSWTLDSGDLYYADFTHNLGTTQLTYLLREYSNDEEVRPEKFDIINTNTVRVFVRGNTEDLQINVVSGRGPTGPQGPQGPAGGGLTDVVDDTTPQLGGTLEMNNQDIEFSTTISNLDTSGFTVKGTVDSNATGFGAVLYMAADGNFDEADANGSTTVPARALAIDTGTGANKRLLLHGFIRNDAWNWTVGGDLFVSTTTGAMTQTAPTGSADYVQKVGFAWTADIVYFAPGDYTLIEREDD